jgi:cobalamin biosynthesis protein CobW
MERLLARPEPFDHIVIETSGLALPQPLVRAFAWPGIATRVTVDGVVTVVDGKAVAEGRFAADESAVQAQREADDASTTRRRCPSSSRTSSPAPT